MFRKTSSSLLINQSLLFKYSGEICGLNLRALTTKLTQNGLKVIGFMFAFSWPNNDKQ